MEPQRIAATLESLGKAFQSDPTKGPAKYAPATARVVQGLKCRITGPAGEVLETDMPTSMGGDGSCPNPGWYFRATLAACLATMVVSRAAQLGIELTDLEVTVVGEGNHRGMLGLDDTISAGHSALRTNARISARNASAEALRALVAWATIILRSGAPFATHRRIRFQSMLFEGISRW
jgi:uncharacterized OsmC-like protein